MGWFSSSKSYFDDSWDKSVEPTANGEDVYAVRYGSRELAGSVPNYSGIMAPRPAPSWLTVSGRSSTTAPPWTDRVAVFRCATE